MQYKHTPGPWEATGNLVRSPMHQPEGLPRGVQIVECRDGYFQPYTEEAKANARLIAAAPELLSALQALFDDFKQLADSCDAGYWSLEETEVGKQAMAAIAKATGSAQ